MSGSEQSFCSNTELLIQGLASLPAARRASGTAGEGRLLTRIQPHRNQPPLLDWKPDCSHSTALSAPAVSHITLPHQGQVQVLGGVHAPAQKVPFSRDIFFSRSPISTISYHTNPSKSKATTSSSRSPNQKSSLLLLCSSSGTITFCHVISVFLPAIFRRSLGNQSPPGTLI